MFRARNRFGPLASCVVAVLAMLAAVPASRGDTTLRWKFAKGQKFQYVMTQKTNTKMDLMGQEIATEQKQIMDITWEVKDVAGDGTADMTQTIDRVRFDLDTPFGGGPIAYDSKSGEVPEGPFAGIANAMNAIVNAPVAMKMNSRGEISDVKIPEKMIEGLKSAGPAGQMSGIASEAGLKSLMTRSGLHLPAEAAAVGKKWNSKLDTPMGPFGSMILDNTYVYEGPDEKAGAERIGVTTKVELKTKEDAPVKMELKSQDAKGAFYFDNAAGMLKRSNLDQKMTMLITAQGMEINQEVESSTVMELAKDQKSSEK